MQVPLSREPRGPGPETIALKIPDLFWSSNAIEARRIRENNDVLGLSVIEVATRPFIEHIGIETIGMQQADIAVKSRPFRLDLGQITAHIADVRLHRLPGEQPAITMDNVID